MFPHMPTALLQNCPELSQPELLGTSFMPHSGMKIVKAANKASDRTSVVGVFLTCAKKTISPRKHSRDRIPACTEGIQNKWTKKICLAIRACSQQGGDTDSAQPQQIPNCISVKKTQLFYSIWTQLWKNKFTGVQLSMYIYIYKQHVKANQLSWTYKCIQNLCISIIYILGSWRKRTSRISNKSYSFILKWGMAALHPLLAQSHPTHLPFQPQSCWRWYDKSPNRGSNCSRGPGSDHKVLVLTIYGISEVTFLTFILFPLHKSCQVTYNS